MRDRASTLRNTPAVSVSKGKYGLLVIVNGVVSTHTLPERGELRIGRARENDIQIVDASVSRVHALLRVGESVTIEDMGSANGTRVRGVLVKPAEPVEVVLGEVMDLGSAMVMVQQRQLVTREWRIWAHGYFEGRLEDECARAARTSGSFGLVRIRVSGKDEGDLVQQVLANTLRTDDVVGLYGPGDYEVLLVERSEQDVQWIVASLEKAWRDVGIAARIGVAHFPREGRSADVLEAKAGALARGAPTPETSSQIIVSSPLMRKLYELLERVAPGDITVLIMGDTGVGKEVMAEHVHLLSPRKAKGFLRLNCAALSESLLESELFGHERGAFTGAHQVKTGLLETAQGGTVFLDEIGELPMSVQVKLLRVLEERQVWRVGGVKPRPIDVRFVAATNRDLENAVTEHKFRQDLYFRLAGVTLHIPPLRERTEEIEPLARDFIQQLSKQGRGRMHELSPEIVELLLGYSWPGNIRELRNAIERAVLLAGEEPILPEHFAVEKMTATVSTPISDAPNARGGRSERPPSDRTTQHATLIPPPLARDRDRDDDDEPTGALSLGDRLRRDVKQVERQHIIDALTRCGGNQTRAARELGISRRTLISRLEAYNIPRPMKDR